MQRFFNKSFFNFAMGFAGVLLVSFAIAALASHFVTSPSPTLLEARQQ